ncbi:MAG: glycosyltransferase family 39 protein, partial [Candidatus Krumholzibacteria bacterium]|nr:glycosyltransferase family 39 protein [Candidatus Krumholzibacteria bacterium]
MGRKNHGSFSINTGALIWVVIGAAMTLRILHVVFTARHNPLASDPALDAANYDRWAKALIGGGDPGPIRLMAAPLYTWFLSLVYRLFGANLTVVRFIQALLGTASCAFIAVITRRLFRSQAAAITAGMAAALYLPSIFYEGLLMPTTIILFLNLLFLICILPKDLSPGPRRLLLAGVVLGLSVTAKPVAILLLPFVVMHLLFVSRGLGT